MKKRFFTLMLGTALFTTNPLFAMDPPEDVLTDVLTKFVHVEDCFEEIEKSLSHRDLRCLSVTSKGMNRGFELFWRKKAAARSFRVLSKGSEREQVEAFETLFSNPEEQYTVLAKCIDCLKKNPKPSPSSAFKLYSFYLHQEKSWQLTDYLGWKLSAHTPNYNLFQQDIIFKPQQGGGFEATILYLTSINGLQGVLMNCDKDVRYFRVLKDQLFPALHAKAVKLYPYALWPSYESAMTDRRDCLCLDRLEVASDS